MTPPRPQGLPLRPKAALDYGVPPPSPRRSPCLSPRDAALLRVSPAPSLLFAVQISPGLLADVDAALGSVDDELLSAIERALVDTAEPAPKPNAAAAAALSVVLLHPPIESELSPGPEPFVPDDSPQGRRIKRALEVPALIPQAVVSDSKRKSRASKDGAQRRRKKALTVRKSLPPVLVRASTSSSSSKSKPITKSSSVVSSRAEFERMLAPLSTQLLISVSAQLERLREAKEKVYCAPGARPSESSFMDVDGRYYLLRKLVPHQHKPERAGDPSPRCMACALRIVHDRSVHVLRMRQDQEVPGPLTEEQVRAETARVILENLGLDISNAVMM